MVDASLKSYLDKIKQLEKPVGYMYVDSTGNVTVGAGHNLTAHMDHKSLPFKTTSRFARHAVRDGDTGIAITLNKVAGRPATSVEIQNDFDFLTKHKGLGKYTVESGLLQKYTTLELGPDAIEALFQKDIQKAVDGVKGLFGKDFDSFPVPVSGRVDRPPVQHGEREQVSDGRPGRQRHRPFCGKIVERPMACCGEGLEQARGQPGAELAHP